VLEVLVLRPTSLEQLLIIQVGVGAEQKLEQQGAPGVRAEAEQVLHVPHIPLRYLEQLILVVGVEVERM